MASESKAQKATPGSGRGCLLLFGGVFVAVGGGIFWFLTCSPLIQLAKAQTWEETPCVIERSYVETFDGDDGDTYAPQIEYSYSFANGDYDGDRYVFVAGSSSGYKRHQRVVDRYPAGSTSVCYVNPKAPEESILNRGLTPDYFFGFLGLLFLGTGLAVVFFGAFQTSSNKPKSARAKRVSQDSGEETDDRPITLESQSGPVGRFIGVFFFALIWNGITAAMIYGILSDGDVETFAYIFMSVFGFVGAILILALFYNFLALFNPRIQLTLASGAANLGEQVELDWTITGSAERVNKLRIWLEGREEARYTRGTDTYTDKNTFATIEIIETRKRSEIRRGRVTIPIPEYTMHSFDGGNNRIIWEIKVEGEISNWPDISYTFGFTILPLELPEAA